MPRISAISYTCVLAAGAALASFLAPNGARAAAYKVLYAFQASIGDGIESGLRIDKAGNFYGTAALGGAGHCAQGCGTIFKVTPGGTATALYSFTGKKNAGAYPWAGLIANKKGNLYGTTVDGGTAGDGLIFELTATGAFKVRHNFAGAGAGDGAHPYAGLLAGANGDFYGTTAYGGTAGLGAVYKVASNGTVTVLYSFTDGSDGGGPTGGLIADSAGNLYGGAQAGGNFTCNGGCGVIYKIAPTGGETVLLAFDGVHGNGPAGTLLADAQGNLYGTTIYGGLYNLGTVFKLATNGTETVLYNFAGGNDGKYPYSSLVMDGKGNLYGTTEFGGANNDGTVFKVTPAGSGGTESLLHIFAGGSDGQDPAAGLVAGKHGELYGTTVYGGGGAGCSSGCGTIFEIKE